MFQENRQAYWGGGGGVSGGGKPDRRLGNLLIG